MKRKIIMLLIALFIGAMAVLFDKAIGFYNNNTSVSVVTHAIIYIAFGGILFFSLARDKYYFRTLIVVGTIIIIIIDSKLNISYSDIGTVVSTIHTILYVLFGALLAAAMLIQNKDLAKS